MSLGYPLKLVVHQMVLDVPMRPGWHWLPREVLVTPLRVVPLLSVRVSD